MQRKLQQMAYSIRQTILYYTFPRRDYVDHPFRNVKYGTSLNDRYTKVFLFGRVEILLVRCEEVKRLYSGELRNNRV